MKRLYEGGQFPAVPQPDRRAVRVLQALEAVDRVFLIVALVICAVYGLWLLRLESGLLQKTEQK